MRAQRAAQLRQPRRDVDDMLDDLARPDDVDGVVLDRQPLAGGPVARVEARHALARAPQRLARHVDGDRPRCGLEQRGAELAGAAADVEHRLAGLHVRQQEVASQPEALGPGIVRHRGPDGVVEGELRRHALHATPASAAGVHPRACARRAGGYPRQMDVADEVIGLERSGWQALSAGADAARAFYAEILDDAVVMLLPGGMLLTDREQILDTMSGAPWSSYELEQPRVLQPAPDAAVVVYGVVAERDGSSYSALVASLYVRRDARWRLALHQQTPR